MAKETVETLIEGGKASAAPPLGPALGPLGVNIGQVVTEINKKTGDFKGMKVPVKVTVDTETKDFEIKIGTPPASALIKKEAGIAKASGRPTVDFVADLKIEQIIKVANMKADSLLGKDNFSRVKEICGTCRAMGVMVEGKIADETIKDINEGAHKAKIESGKTELSDEELKALEEEKKVMEQELASKRKKYEAKAKDIMSQMANKAASLIRKKMVEEKIPEVIMNEICPADDAGKK